MTASEIEIPDSPFDHARRLISELPKERAGYIMARVALASVGTDRYPLYVGDALNSLAMNHDTGDLQPPLSDELREKVEVMREHFSMRDGRYPASMILLAQLIDEDAGK